MSMTARATRLDRTQLVETGRPPVRIIHLGLGAFHRAHEAWYTAHSSDSDEWGIAAFTGRTAEIAQALAPQDGLYTLIERGETGDRMEVVSSIVRVLPGDDVASFVDLMARAEVVILSLTITEAGYRVDLNGRPDLEDRDVRHDVDALRAALAGDRLEEAPIRTALGRVLLGLEARRRAGVPALTVVPCDNIPDNARFVGRALRELAALVDPWLSRWLERGISVVSTSVDRITPRATAADKAEVLAARGWIDEAPVVCEPFSDWVMSGAFPSGRPAWESAGARFVEDIEPWEARKLWMLNGAHTLLAALGVVRGHETVKDAIADPLCRALVLGLWEEDARNLPGIDVDDYSAQLLERFRNPRIEHRLAQIAIDAATKVRLRIIPVATRERAAGRSAAACAAAVAAWMLSRRPEDAGASAPAGVNIDTSEALRMLDATLSADADFCRSVDDAIRQLSNAALPSS